MTRALRLALAALLLGGCAEIPNVAEPTLAGSLPASFSGDLPCADCPGLRYRLNLFPDGAYFLRSTYLGRPKGEQDDLGAWSLSGDARSIVLKGRRSALLTLQVFDRATLKLDGHDLKRDAKFEPLEPRLPMRGMYRYTADAGLFTECLTRQRWPVRREAASATLQQAYAGARRKPGEEVLVEVDGRVSGQPRSALAVERVIGVWPGESCGARFAGAPLENTYWRLTRIGDEPVVSRPGQRELHLVLQGNPSRVSGFAGCNRLGGEYRVAGSLLSFGKVAMTRMACPSMQLETSFAAALERVAEWKVTGGHLELFDASGALLLRFEARTL